jgi:hypothetical protein
VESLGELGREYGPWIIIVLLLLTNEKAQNFIRGIVGAIIPAWGERWKARQERERYERERGERERIESLLLAKDTMADYRQEMKDMKAERERERESFRMERMAWRNEQLAERAKTLDVVKGYEKAMAVYVEVMRDQSELLRQLVDRADTHDNALNILSQKVNQLSEKMA